MSHPRLNQPDLVTVLGHYPLLGELQRVLRNGLSVNTATCLFETSSGTFFAKAYDPRQRDAASIHAEHRLVRRLIEREFPTPALHANQEGNTLTWFGGLGYVLSDVARGEDRYGAAGVFEPYGTAHEARSAGAALARFHRVLADGPTLAPRGFLGLTARYDLMGAPSLPSGLAALVAEAPAALGFLTEHPDWPLLVEVLEARRPAIAEHLPHLPRGLIHGDFIKRNLFWQGTEVSDVIDFDLWNVGYWVYDLALALLPCGFDWPRLLRGEGSPRLNDMRAFLEGYRSVRALSEPEHEVLPRILETARVEFYLGAIATMLRRGDPAAASRFRDLLLGTTRWFHEHPDWSRDAFYL